MRIMISAFLLVICSFGQEWEKVREQVLQTEKNYRKWGIECECDESRFSDRLPSYLKISAAMQAEDTMVMDIEVAAGEKNSLAVKIGGSFQLVRLTNGTKGEGTVALRGTGIDSRFAYDSSVGFRVNSEFKRYQEIAGIKIVENPFSIQAGPVTCKIDPGAFMKMLIASGQSSSGVMLNLDLGMYARAICDKQPDASSLTLVSLKRLKQNDLCGLTTICGLLVDKPNGDVILVGRREKGMPPIETGLLVIALRSIWEEGLNPFVSIDPDPSNDSAPHKPRFGGVSKGLEQTALINILFEADYEMKRINLGESSVKCDGFKSKYDLLAEKKSEDDEANKEEIWVRFWLTPRTASVGDVWEYESPKGTVYMFRTDVEIHTERLMKAKNSLEGTGKTDPVSELACVYYMNYFDGVESSFPIFKQLRQAFEVLMVARVLRLKNIRAAALYELCKNSVSEDRHRDEFPVIGPKRVKQSNYSVLGGVDTKVSLDRSKIVGAKELSPLVESLDSATWDGAAADAGMSLLPMMQEAKVTNSSVLVEATLNQAWQDFYSGRNDDAVAKLSQVIESAPDSGEAFLLRAVILYNLRKYEESLKDSDMAVTLLPASAKALSHRGLVKSKLGDLDGGIRDCDKAIEMEPNNVDALKSRAMAKHNKGDIAEALKDYDHALKLDPSDAATYCNRGNAKRAVQDYEGALKDYTRAIELSPDDSTAFLNRGLLKHEKNDLSGAQEDYGRAMKLDPRDDTAHNNMGIILKEEGKLDEAIAEYSKAIELNPQSANALANRGLAKSDSGDLKGAIADFSAALEINPKYVMAYFNRASAYSDAGDNEGAIEDYSKAIEIDPTNASSYINRGVCRSRTKDYAGAIADYTKALEIDPKRELALLNRASSRHSLKDLNGAIEDYSAAIELNPKNASAHSNRGNARYDLKDYEGAIADFTRAIELNPEDAGAYFNRGLAYHECDDVNAADRDYSDAIRLNPKNAAAFINRGIIRSQKKDYDGAIQDYTAALSLNPKSASSYLNRGIARHEKGDLEGAIADYTKSIELNPKSQSSYLNRGYAHKDKSDTEKAVNDFTKAIELNPKSSSAYFSRANILYDKRDYEGSIADFSKVVEIDPKNSGAYYNRGLSRYASKDIKGAISDWEKCLQIDPKNQRADDIKNMIQRAKREIDK